ncbi:Ulp1 protease family, C-terminal catalytic domain [Sesbania bispinosa]|nr:Ulp1 protease family, C-terminal catalytic domain [Sesbania bispinosa]
MSKVALEMKENEEAHDDVGNLRNLSSSMKEGNTIVAGYMNYNPPHTSQVDGRTSGMIIPEEFIIKWCFANGEKRYLKSLIPIGMVDQELLACKPMKKAIIPHVGSYPQHSRSSKVVMGYYQDDFMGIIELLSKIFVPINDGHLHWYLLVVDLKEKLLVILDSKPNPTLSELRRRNIKKLSLFMEEMFQYNSFYEFCLTPKPLISECKIKEAEGVGEQLPGSLLKPLE